VRLGLSKRGGARAEAVRGVNAFATLPRIVHFDIAPLTR